MYDVFVFFEIYNGVFSFKMDNALIIVKYIFMFLITTFFNIVALKEIA